MFNKGDYVVYKHDVAKIIEIKKNHLNNRDYYILVPVNDQSLKIDVPVENRLNNVKPLITKESIDELISKINSIPVIDVDTKMVETEYKRLLREGTYEGLITLIKTTYLRNKERKDSNRKVGDKDNYYFNLAEQYLYTELSFVLKMSYEDTREYVIKMVEKSSKNE